MKQSVIGMDIAKKVFQLHTVDRNSGKIERIKLRRDEVLAFFTQRQPCLVAIEACGSAHWWARQLRQQGHEVRLLAPRSVRLRLTPRPSGPPFSSRALAWSLSSRLISRPSSRCTVSAPNC